MLDLETNYLDVPGATYLNVFQTDALARAGVTFQVIDEAALFCVRGLLGLRGYFDPEPTGRAWIAIPQGDDIVFWSHESGKFAFWNSSRFSLGEERIGNASTYAFGRHLNVFATPLDWLAAECDGIVVIDWTAVFERLREAPRIAVAPPLIQRYQAAMRPQHWPELAVIRDLEAA